MSNFPTLPTKKMTNEYCQYKIVDQRRRDHAGAPWATRARSVRHLTESALNAEKWLVRQVDIADIEASSDIGFLGIDVVIQRFRVDMFGTIKRMLGWSPPPPINSDPFSRKPKPLPTAARSVAAGPGDLTHVILRREEIIDAKTRIAGYRFEAPLPESPDQRYAVATFQAFRASNIAAFAERRMALIPVKAQEWFKFDYPSLIGPHTVFLLDRPPAHAEHLERWCEVARLIRGAGARVALFGIDIAHDGELIRKNADLLLIDFSSYSLRNFELFMTRLKSEHPKLEIIADNVSSWPERRYRVAHDVAYCIGHYTTCTDEESPSGKFNQSRQILIEMLNLLLRNADLADITEVAKRDPGVAVQIVSMANSPLQGLSKPVANFEQAIMILGREQLYRWLSIGMFRAGGGSPHDEVLLELALVRGRFLELVGRKLHDKAKCGELFLVGLLSLLDCMLAMPMAKVLEHLHLSDQMRHVLLHSEGPLGRYLLLAIAVEKGSANSITRLAKQLTISEEDIGAASTEALTWAENAL